MSGPKVVNVAAVRRRQKREGLAALHQLERAIAECSRFDTQAAASEMLEHLHKLRDSEQWAELSNQAPSHRDFYREHLQHLQRQHAENHAARLRRAHRLQQAATQQAIMDADTSQTTETNQLRTLATEFTDPAANTNSLPTAPVDPADPHEQRLEKCWELLGQLSALEHSPALLALTEKAEALRREPAARRLILLDSLVLEISEHLKHQRALSEAQNELHAILADIADLEDSATWTEQITTALARQTSTLETLQSLARDARAWADDTFDQETRRQQRAAVLRAIAAAGYEIRQGMATAWAENGRIVLQKPNDTQYGIEISAPPQGTAIQTRVVAFNESRDPRRDLEIEQTWCSEFQHARDLLETEGFQATLLQAHQSGTIPLKVISTPQPRQISTTGNINTKT